MLSPKSNAMVHKMQNADPIQVELILTLLVVNMYNSPSFLRRANRDPSASCPISARGNVMVRLYIFEFLV